MNVALAVPFVRGMMTKGAGIEAAEEVHYGASIGLPSGPSGTGTRLEMAGIDLR